jgi:Na+-transporting NADH:ubiquinone oxidoreductase subunit A
LRGLDAVKLKGGYNVMLRGKPGPTVEVLPEPEVLYLPLWSRRFAFSEVNVREGEHVLPGHVLARDPENHSVPLLAPRAGTVRLEDVEGHIVLRDVAREPEEPHEFDDEMRHISRDMGSIGMKRYKLLTLGAWQFLQDAHTGQLPDPFGTPRAVIVTTVNLDPFVARGDTQIQKRLFGFTRGLEHLQSLLEYQPIYLVMPDVESEFASQVRELLRGYAHVQLHLIPLRYGLGHVAVVARRLGLGPDPQQPIWALGVQGLLAMDRALTRSKACDVRIVSVGGPSVESAGHLKAMAGYPVREILGPRVSGSAARIVNGGVLTGRTMPPEQMGLDVECEGLTVVPEHAAREFLGFARPGWDRRSYGKSFVSLFRKPFAEALTTALRGERRACIACGFCEEVCPARIIPHVIHKYLYQDELEEAEKAGLRLCVRCGLCSFVCPSKIELREQLVEAQETVRTELQAAEAEA